MKKNIVVYAGGVAGIETLQYGNSSATFRFNGGGLYLHGVGWGHLNHGQKKAVVLQNCGSPFMVEIGFGQGEAHDRAWFKRYIERYHKLGLRPDFMTSNCFSGTDKIKDKIPGLERWDSFVQDFKDGGIDVPIYPVWEYQNYLANRKGKDAPRLLNEFRISRNSHFQDLIRRAGGLVIDTAGKFFFKCPREYRDYIIDAVRWARKEKLFVGSYASPYMAQDQYQEWTVKYLDYLKTAEAWPDALIVGNYREPEPIGYKTVVGREWIPDTCLGVAHFLLNEYYRKV